MIAHQNDSKIDTNKNSSQAQSMNKNENNELVPVCDIKEETADSDDELQLSHQETFGINSRIPEMFNFSPSPSNLLSTLSGRQRRINSFGIPFEYVPYGSHRATPDGNNLLFKGYRYYKDGANIYKKSREIRIYWRCINIPGKCRARLHTSIDYYVVKVVGDHQLSCLLKMATASRYNVDRLPTFK
uniref:CSON002385 protein n=1 Tax=Culicoides sonorensis TaxID=179676 RepID=A0A336LLU9_CULSO